MAGVDHLDGRRNRWAAAQVAAVPPAEVDRVMTDPSEAWPARLRAAVAIARVDGRHPAAPGPVLVKSVDCALALDWMVEVVAPDAVLLIVRHPAVALMASALVAVRPTATAGSSTTPTCSTTRPLDFRSWPAGSGWAGPRAPSAGSWRATGPAGLRPARITAQERDRWRGRLADDEVQTLASVLGHFDDLDGRWPFV